MAAPTIAFVIASVREQRFADIPANWMLDRLAARDDLIVDVIDLRELPPLSSDIVTAPFWARRRYATDAEAALGARLDAADGFLVLTSEFNHGYPAALKHLLDHFFVEFEHKPAAFAGYGNVGAARAIEQLRLVVAELGMVSVRESTHILGPHFAPLRAGGASAAEVWEHLAPRFGAMVESLLWWARGLRAARSLAQ